MFNLNRRMRQRTYGGVRGRGHETPPTRLQRSFTSFRMTILLMCNH